MLYPHGWLRKPLRFAVRRAVLNCPAWRPGAYIVLDTGGWLHPSCIASCMLFQGAKAGMNEEEANLAWH